MMLMLSKWSAIFYISCLPVATNLVVKAVAMASKVACFWVETLDASDFVLDMIGRGYRLPFAEYPSQCFLKNNRSALQHSDFVTEAIIKLVSNGCIVEHDVCPFCVNPLTVAEGKKLRLVIDLRHINNCFVKPRFKYEDLRSLSQVLDEGHWVFTWDLKSGYHHVDICLDHQKYLGFAWPFSGVVRYFTFAVLPFGLGSACFCFTKLMRPLVRRWRSMGLNSFIYLDDGFGSRPDKCSATAASLIQREELSSSGLCCNEEKSHWTPMQIGEWLGFMIHTISMSFRIPDYLQQNTTSTCKIYNNLLATDNLITYQTCDTTYLQNNTITIFLLKAISNKIKHAYLKQA